MLCPITKALYVDPVIAADGETYERTAIERWITDKQAGLEAAQLELDESAGTSERAKRVLAAGVVSPMGHGELEDFKLVPSRTVKRMVNQWLDKGGGAP